MSRKTIPYANFCVVRTAIILEMLYCDSWGQAPFRHAPFRQPPFRQVW